jgi:hypothetical protein
MDGHQDTVGSSAPRVVRDERLRLPKLRARVTNNQDLLPGLDGRTAAARRYRDLVLAFIADMGGLDQCSEVRLGLLRRLAATTVQAELIEARAINGEQVDVSLLCTLASTTVRIAARLGLNRVSRDVTLTLDQYLRQEEEREARERAAASAAEASNE